MPFTCQGGGGESIRDASCLTEPEPAQPQCSPKSVQRCVFMTTFRRHILPWPSRASSCPHPTIIPCSPCSPSWATGTVHSALYCYCPRTSQTSFQNTAFAFAVKKATPQVCPLLLHPGSLLMRCKAVMPDVSAKKEYGIQPSVSHHSCQNIPLLCHAPVWLWTRRQSSMEQRAALGQWQRPRRGN
jgi:hypothetical protein